MKKFQYLFLAVILILGFILRLHNLSAPIADWHSWRQADTSAVSRNFIQNGFDFLHPKFEDLSNVPSGLENPSGYRFVEFPIYNFFQAGLLKTFGIFTLEEWGRLVTIFSSLLTIVFLYFLLLRYTNFIVAISTSFFYSVIPYNIFFGRVILPDPMMVMATIGGIYLFDLWLHENKKNKRILFSFLSFVFLSSAILFKPFSGFFFFPLFAIAYEKHGLKMFRVWKFWFFAFLCILPLILWRIWMSQYPEGIPASSWLFNEGNIRFKGAFFYWIFAERIGGLILGFWGLPLLILGILSNTKSESAYGFKKNQMLLFWSFLVSSIAYLVVVAKGNVQHDYYQIPIIPTLMIFAGLGVNFLINPPREFIKRSLSIFILIICVVFSVAFRWYTIRDFFNINNPVIITAGEAIDRLTPKDAKVIANYSGDTTFLYQTKRVGWASYEHDLPEMIKLGAQYLVVVNPTKGDLNYADGSKIIEKTSDFIIFDLTKK